MKSGSTKNDFLTRYLDAKYRIDSRSLNQATLRRFLSRLSGYSMPVILDLGAGTGSTLRRLIDVGFQKSFTYYGLDMDPDLTHAAADNHRELFESRGFVVTSSPNHNDLEASLTAKRKNMDVTIVLLTGNIFDTDFQERFSDTNINTVTANAFFDLVPLGPALRTIKSILRPGGMLYSTINYDGRTTILPQYENEDFEEKLYSVYDRSMDSRATYDGEVGGHRCGSKMYGALEAEGYRIVGYGNSDWSIFPWGDEYRNDEKVFLTSLVRMIYDEALQHPELDRNELDSWFQLRNRQLETARLSLFVHQSDQLAIG